MHYASKTLPARHANGRKSGPRLHCKRLPITNDWAMLSSEKKSQNCWKKKKENTEGPTHICFMASFLGISTLTAITKTSLQRRRQIIASTMSINASCSVRKMMKSDFNTFAATRITQRIRTRVRVWVIGHRRKMGSGHPEFKYQHHPMSSHFHYICKMLSHLSTAMRHTAIAADDTLLAVAGEKKPSTN